MKFLKRAAIISALLLVSAAPVASANATPNFSFKDVDGSYHRLSEYRGKWVIVNYWATYCRPCVAELPTLNNIARRYKDRVVVLGLDAGETPAAELKQFAVSRGLSFPIVPTQRSTLNTENYASPLGLIWGTPTTFIINPNGQVVDSQMGPVSVAQLQQYFHQDKRSSVAKEKENNCPTGVC